MRARIGVVCLLLSTLSLQAALVAGPERRVAPPTVGGSLQAFAVDVASDVTDFLVLWTDSTPGREGFYATPVEANGTPQGGPRLPFLTSRLAWKSAHAVWTGSAYLVVASEENDVNSADFSNRVAVLDRDGNAGGIPSALNVHGIVRSLTWSGHHALALYQDVTTRRLHGALLDAQGQLVRDVELPSGTVAEAAAVPGGFLVFGVFPPGTSAVSTFHVGAFQLSETGEMKAPVKIAELPLVALTYASASAHGTVGLAVLASTPVRSLYRFTIDAGTLATTAHPVVTISQQTPSLQVVPTPAGFAVALGFMSASAERLSAIDFDSSTALRTVYEGSGAGIARIATSGSVVLSTVATVPLTEVTLDARIQRKITDPQVIAITGIRQILPAIGTSPEGSMVAWIDQTASPGGTVFVRRFDRAGNALDESPEAIGAGSISGNVAVTFTGKVWLVAWQNGLSDPAMRVLVRRIGPDGTLLDAEPIDTGSGTQPALASNGTTTVLARGGLSYAGINTLALSPEGVLLETTPRVLTTKAASMPAIATNGREFAVVWRGTGSAELGILAARLSPTGTVLDASPIAITQPSLYSQLVYPSVASAGDDFLIVYGSSTRAPAEAKTVIESKRLLRTGVLADSIATAAGTVVGAGAIPRIAPLASGYVVTFFATDAPLSLVAVTTDERGSPLSGPRVIQSANLNSPAHGLAVNVATAWVVYTRLDESLAHAQRVFLRPVGEDLGGKRRAARR